MAPERGHGGRTPRSCPPGPRTGRPCPRAGSPPRGPRRGRRGAPPRTGREAGARSRAPSPPVPPRRTPRRSSRRLERGPQPHEGVDAEGREAAHLRVTLVEQVLDAGGQLELAQPPHAVEDPPCPADVHP